MKSIFIILLTIFTFPISLVVWLIFLLFDNSNQRTITRTIKNGNVTTSITSITYRDSPKDAELIHNSFWEHAKKNS